MITTPEKLARWAYELFSEQGSGILSAANKGGPGDTDSAEY